MEVGLILELGNKFGNLFVFAFILSRLKAFRNLIAKRPVKLWDKLLLCLIFGLFGIVGTYFSIEFNGALINTRIIGVGIGGLLGGPFVGLMSGAVAGIHRALIDSGEFTSTACAISTVFEGLMAGYMGRVMQNKNKKWIYAGLTGAIGESMRKISVLIFSKPFYMAVDLVKDIWLPMVIINSLGMALLFIIIENIFKEQEKMGAYQANLTLKIADKALPFVKQGIYSDTISNVAEIIYNMTEFDAVSISDTERIITHIGLNNEASISNSNYISNKDLHTIKTGEVILVNDCSKIKYEDCEYLYQSFMVLPLKENNKIIGSLKLYKKLSNSITAIDLELGTGLAKLFSTQLTLGKLEQNSKLLAAAEFKALQAQINPHFLFNSLTVIASLCRIDPEKARNLIIHLSNYFRKNLNNNKDVVKLEVELNHVKSYIEIEMARFEDKLKIIYEMEDDLRCFIPPLSLQPIVENAIKHGILPQKQGGTVRIKGSKKDDEVNIIISDDGVGIEENKVLQILRHDNKYDTSIGINNVNLRLKGIFGERYGLKIESKVGTGTSVHFKIPIITFEMGCGRGA
ncbi:MAG: histidine kinase [Maledivibacter sp.]|jgi:two-component system sensor histidine kinase LytS|nr:histidine kinase [Maledivibacter sp.]